MFLADLHVHSRFSDGQMTIPELVDFYGRRGFGAIAVTDHVCEESTWLGRAARYLSWTLTESSFDLYLDTIREEAARAWRKYRLRLIPGFELSQNSLRHHRSAHILGLGVSKFLRAEGEVETLARKIRDQGALTVAAHPLSTGRAEIQTLHLWHRRHELAPLFDAWEVATGVHWFAEVRGSGLPMLATSDLHRPAQIRSWKSVFDCERHPDAILEAIRKQKLDFHFYQAG